MASAKIHEHDNKPPKGYGLILQRPPGMFLQLRNRPRRWLEDFDVHRDPPEKHQAALQMGADLIQFVFTMNPVTP
jgi:hypothetical protein